MRKRILLSSFVLLSLFLAAVFIALIRFANQTTAQVAAVAPSEKQTPQPARQGGSWAQKMAQAAALDYHFPVNELFIKLELEEAKPPKEHIFQLVIERSDLYSHFCIMQTLQAFPFSYSVVKDRQGNVIYVNAQGKEMLDAVVKRLKEYDIESIVKEAWL
ncbi:MAG: hypothetical protein IBX45_01025 [Campylobacterales bacterium]|nr:hypothetical protein [Campylobacterales bacterium]